MSSSTASTPPHLGVFLLLLVAVAGILPLGAAAVSVDGDTPIEIPGTESQQPTGTVPVELTSVSATEGNTPQRNGDTVYHWSTDRIHLSATVQNVQGNAVLCLKSSPGACLELPADSGTSTIAFSWDRPSGVDRTRATFVVKNADTGAVVTERTVTVQFITRNGNLDGDGLTNVEEAAAGTAVSAVDTDGDGAMDGAEVTRAASSPTNPDSDGDGVVDGGEYERNTDPAAADSDADGVSDSRELQFGTDPTLVDTDGDGLNDALELQITTNPRTAWTSIVNPSTMFGFLFGVGLTLGLLNRRQLQLLGLFSQPVLTAGGVVETVVGGVEDRLSAFTYSPTGDDSPDPADSDATVVTGTAIGGEPDDPSPAAGADGTSTAVDTPLSTDPETLEEIFEQSRIELVEDAVVIKRMLNAEGGQLRQARFVEVTDWSKAKVSRLLTRMSDDGEVVKIRIGRENLICLEGEEPQPTTHDESAEPNRQHRDTHTTLGG